MTKPMATESNGKITKASAISLGLAATVLLFGIQTTWKMATGLSDMRIEQTAGFAKIDGQINLLRFQLDEQKLSQVASNLELRTQIADIRTFIGQGAPSKK